MTDTTQGIFWREDCKTLQRLLELSDSEIRRQEIQALLMVQQGQEQDDVANELGIHKRTLERWLAMYQEGGLELVHTYQPPQKPLPATNYQLVQGERVSTSIRRMTIEQIDRALWQLTDSDWEQDKAVHDARKCFKRIRTLLRLVRKDHGKKIHRKLDRAVANAGRQLASLRESAVHVMTVDKLANDESEFALIKQNLELRHGHVSKDVLGNEDNLEAILDSLADCRENVAGLVFSRQNYGLIRNGIRWVYRQGRKRMLIANEDITPVNIHEWRKRLKDLGYVLQILYPIEETTLKQMSELVDGLQEQLGNHHDLAELRSILENEPDLYAGSDEGQRLDAAAAAALLSIESGLWSPADEIYADKPSVFVDRLEDYWQEWSTNH